MLKGAFSKGTQQCECQGWAGVSAKEGQKQGPQGEKHSIHRLFSGPPLWDPTQLIRLTYLFGGVRRGKFGDDCLTQVITQAGRNETKLPYTEMTIQKS